ncbi:MAG: carboxypeptidase-like regulatory domain-containing protein [Pirellulales bacterium]
MLRNSLIGIGAGCFLLVGCLTLSGCGDGLTRVPITGLLTVQGQPLAGASVQFFPTGSTQGLGAIGTSGPDGKFTVISSRDNDAGVPAGKYTVRVSLMMDGKGNILPPEALQADYPDAQEAVPAPYSTSSSNLEITIPEQGGEVKIDLPVKLKGKKK